MFFTVLISIIRILIITPISRHVQIIINLYSNIIALFRTMYLALAEKEMILLFLLFKNSF